MIQLHLHAGLRDLAGTARLELPWNPETTVKQVRVLVSGRLPVIADLLARSSIAVNNQIQPDGFAIPDRAEVSLLPPVSGG